MKLASHFPAYFWFTLGKAAIFGIEKMFPGCIETRNDN